MKRILALILVFLLTLTMSGAVLAEADDDDWAAADIVDDWPEDDASDDPFADDAEGEIDWDEEDAFGDVSDPVNIWNAAMEVYSWFTIQPLDVDYDVPNEDGTKWQVLDERFDSMESLSDIANFYFCDVIADDILDCDFYEEVEGILYASDDGRAVDERMLDADVLIAEETEDKLVLEVTVQYPEPNEFGLESEEFVFIREIIDGEWQFTAFPFFW